MHYLFEVIAKPGYTIEQYAQAWVRASELIQQAPGAQGTRLHRKIGDESTALAIAMETRPRATSPASLPGCAGDHRVSGAVCRHPFVGEFKPPSGRCSRLIGSSRRLRGSPWSCVARVQRLSVICSGRLRERIAM